MLKLRIITALSLLPVVGIVLFALNLKAFAGALLIVTYLMANEWARLSSVEKPFYKSFYALGVAVICLLVWEYAPAIEFWPSPSWYFEWHNDTSLIAYWASLAGWLVAVCMILFTPNGHFLWSRTPWVRLILGVILLVGFWVSIISLRSNHILTDNLRGGWIVLFMLTIIWAADIGGYTFGKLFGKHKLAPRVSPGKTWEGFLGGVVFSLIVATVGSYLLELPISNVLLFISAIFVMVVISVFGDLFESLLKRQVHLKDSSNLLPGHGGVLDRMDSSIAMAPFFLLISKGLGWL